MSKPRHLRRGFTLIELLTVVAVLGLLASLLVPMVRGSLARGHNTRCLATLRGLGQGFHLYLAENGGTFPRSFHSAGAHREANWAMAIAPFLDTRPTPDLVSWTGVFNDHFRCPSHAERDVSRYSYGMNVYFELSPEGDDYPGSPKTWRNLMRVERPSATLLLAETKPTPFGDHFMCHQWSGIQAARNAVDRHRHGKTSHYLFADGRVKAMAVEMTFDPARGINLWHP